MYELRDVFGEDGFRLEDARLYWVLLGVPLRETFRFVSDCLVRSAGDDCLSLRALAAEGDLAADFGVRERGGERGADSFRGVTGGGGVVL
jgi:hypothetical protein